MKNMKILIIFILLLYSKNDKCKKNILNTFELDGYEKPDKTLNKICPTIINNCCTEKDKKSIYYRFKKMGEEDRIDIVYDSYYKNHVDLLTIMKKFEYFLKFKYKSILKKNINLNCKILLNSILKFKSNSLLIILQNKAKDFISFLKISHKSIYCLICDYDKQQFINTNSNIIIYSKNFCSKWVKNSINFLIWKFYHLPKIIELYSNFLLKCNNSNFKYNSLKYIKKVYLLNENLAYGIKIKNCYDNKKENEWIDYCKFICLKFNIGRFNKFFIGDSSKIIFLTKFLKYKLENFIKTSYKNLKMTHIKLLTAKDIYNYNSFKNRILEIENSGKEVHKFNKFFKLNLVLPVNYEFKNDFEYKKDFKIYNDIFKESIINKLELFTFKPKIHFEGLDFETIGKGSRIKLIKTSYIQNNLVYKRENQKKILVPVSSTMGYEKKFIKLMGYLLINYLIFY